ncbi:MAG: hypothetical protein ABIO56_04690 [Ferruginibacter sp.]
MANHQYYQAEVQPPMHSKQSSGYACSRALPAEQSPAYNQQNTSAQQQPANAH